MPTQNPRINVTFREEIATKLSEIAAIESLSVSGLVRELTLEALETREDIALSKIALSIDKSTAKKYSHEEAWK